jgi:hypothetical protein
MASAFILYGANKADFRLNDFPLATLKLALLGSSYPPNATTVGDSLWGDVSAHEIVSGNGYNAGGAVVPSVTLTTTNDGYVFSSGAVVWNSIGGGIAAHYYYVMYVVGTLWGKSSPLVGYYVGNTASVPIPLTPPGTPLSVTPPAGGWIDLV